MSEIDCVRIGSTQGTGNPAGTTELLTAISPGKFTFSNDAKQSVQL